MDEADWNAEAKPIIDERLAAEIAEQLGVADPSVRAHLHARLQRYTDRLFFARKRERFKKSPGAVRADMRSLLTQIERLLETLQRLPFSEEVPEAYRKARRKSGSQSPSLDTLIFELAALTTIAKEVANAPPLKSGQRGRPLLHRWVGAFMALFETVAGERPRHTYSSEGVKGDYLSGRGGVALRTLFEAISPETEEKTLAGIVQKIDAEFDGSPMRESDFDLISAIEEIGGVSVVQVQT